MKPTNLNSLNRKRIPRCNSNWKTRKHKPWNGVTAPEAMGLDFVLSTYIQYNTIKGAANYLSPVIKVFGKSIYKFCR